MRKLKYIAAAAALLMAAGAWAGQPGNAGNGNGGCGAGQQTNGCSTTTPPASSNAANGIGVGVGVGVGVGIAHGGNANAQGGQGGNGGVGIGGSVAGSGNSSNTNINANSASNRNDIRTSAQQGQLQGQQQGQVATGGNASNGGNTVSGTQANGQAVTVNGDSVTYQAQDRAPVSTAYAGPLTASNGSCMGSSSAGAQGVAIGLSFGTTWSDSSCDMRYDAEALRAAGQPRAAVARLCQKSEIAAAMKAAGTPCESAKTASTGVSHEVASAAPDLMQPQYTDPIVRARLGLPPLKN